MSEKENDIVVLKKRLDQLINGHNALNDEILSLRALIGEESKKTSEPEKLDTLGLAEKQLQELIVKYNSLSKEIIELRTQLTEPDLNAPVQQPTPPTAPTAPAKEYSQEQKEKQEEPIPEKKQQPILPARNWESFIGTNLLNKVGILILVIGAGIGVKYAIDNDLISPVTRIAMSYLLGSGLLALAYRLKANYKAFSAVLLSGALAILYFTTFVAYDIYGIIDQLPAYIIMLAFTIFTVIAAIQYDQQIIGLLGLAGSYAIPFLLSQDSGNIAALSTYITIINAGILGISYFKYWKLLFYASFVITWIIFSLWYFDPGVDTTQFTGVIFTFTSLFFLEFYAIFLANKLVRKEAFNPLDSLSVILNSLIYFGLVYHFLEDLEGGLTWQGLFTLGNAILHFGVVYFIRKRKLDDPNTFYIIIGLVILFLTIAIPVQLEGSWVTIVWSVEAAILFVIGLRNKVRFYEFTSYLIMFVAFFSLVEDWYSIRPETAFFNTRFITNALYVVAFGYILRLHLGQATETRTDIQKIMNVVIPAFFLIGLYGLFSNEINTFWWQKYLSSEINLTTYSTSNYDLLSYQALFNVAYTLIFFMGLTYVIHKKFENRHLDVFILVLNVLVLLGSISHGLETLGSLKDSFIEGSEYYDISIWNIISRYPVFALILGLVYLSYRLIRDRFPEKTYRIGFQIILHLTVLTLLSNELIQWLELGGARESDKLGLSILWGVYGILLIVLGIWKSVKYLRISGITLFSITLLKLFFYDLRDLDTLSKTVVFITLGIIFLLASFLYNKFKERIGDE